MKEEFRHIVLNTGDVSLKKKLGVYYIDMRPSKIHYTENIYGGGFDEDGVPMNLNAKGEKYYYPINIAQYGLMLHADYIEFNRHHDLIVLLNCIKRLEYLKRSLEDYDVWHHYHWQENYKIAPPWASSMAQGQLISLYLRVWQITGNKVFFDTATRAYNFYRLSYEEGGVQRIDEDGNLWLEEYPSDPPSYVLNGFIYAIFGLYDLYRVTNREDVMRLIEQCIRTLDKSMHKFDCGYWSFYDLRKTELVRYYYQKNVHIPQLKVLYILTGENVFDYYASKWEKTLNPLNFVFVRIMYRVRPRKLRLLSLLNSCLKRNE